MPFREGWLEKLKEVGQKKREAIEAYRRSRISKRNDREKE
jgi:hypothetical protein